MAGANTGTSQPARKIVILLGSIVAICVIVTTLTHYLWPELTGVPSHPVSIPNLVIGDVSVAFLAIAAFYHGRKTMGTEKSAFFSGRQEGVRR
ncbi:MAG: hypothetical protein GYA24_00080 [Candidatus Lokiarchaeota archaeon]|nr:hypothetical protein [Candidatus Lokiarchaeota archaeon]